MHPATLIRTVLISLIVSLPLAAQTYTYSVAQGEQPYTATLRPSATLIMSGKNDNVLTAWQAIPFDWSFYGSPVKGYFASDNGYITFDSSARVSVPDNLADPAAGAPNAAIYAFWDELHFTGSASAWSNEIRTITVGDAPNRAHVIMWVSVVPAGVEWSMSNSLSFAIVLIEGGGFDIIQVAGQRSVRTLSASIGCENADGTMASWVTGSPSLDFPALTSAASDDISYHFTYSDNQYDMTVLNSTLPKQTRSGTPVIVGGTVKNLGGSTLHAFTLSYSVDGNAPVRMPVTSIAVTSNGTYDFSFPLPWTPPAAGVLHTIAIWASELDGTEPDQNPVNDTLVAHVFTILGTSTARNPLVEEFTGAWCGWCPDGGLILQSIEQAHPNAVLVSIHAGGTDAMKTAAGDGIAEAFKPAYPMAMIDRVQFRGQASVPISRTGNAWLLRTAERQAVGAPASLDIAVTYDSLTRNASITVDALYVDYGYPGDIRLHVLVVEDRVIGSGTGYDQANYYSQNSSYPNHPYYSETNPIKGYVHRHVLRESLTGMWGDQTVLPLAPQAGQTYSAMYTYTVPTGHNPAEMSIVAFLSTMGSGLHEREVINAAKSYMIPHTTFSGVVPAVETLTLIAYPQPSQGAGTVRLDLPVSERIQLTVIDAVGRVAAVLADRDFAPGTVHFLLPSLPPGVYRIVARTGKRIAAVPWTTFR